MKLSHQNIVRIVLITVGIFILLYILLPGPIMFDMPPHIKNFLWIIFIVSGILLLIAYFNPKESPPPPLPQRNEIPQAENRITGSVIDYAANGIGYIDKIQLLQNNQKIWLHFPPHTAQQVMNVAVKNTTVTVTATVRNNPAPINNDTARYELISLHSNALDKTVNINEIPPPPPAPGKEIEVKGNTIELKSDESGHVTGFVLSGKMIELPLHTAETLLPLMRQAHEITVKGYRPAAMDGFVNISGMPFIKPVSITIDNINYVIQ